MVRINDYTLGAFNPNSSGLGFGGSLNAVLTTVGDSVGEDGLNDFNGGGGGGVRVTSPDYIFNVSADVRGADVLINGVSSGKQTPAEIRVSKSDLITNGEKVITLVKTGYTTNEKYVVSLDTLGATLVKNDVFDGGYGGLSQSQIVCKYYIKNVEQPTLVNYNIGNSKKLLFKLSASSGVSSGNTEYNFIINSTGKDGSVLIRKNTKKSANMFPDNGKTTYRDRLNTQYTILSSDITKYRISKIVYEDGSTLTANNNIITADASESLTLQFSLSKNFIVNVEVEDVPTFTPPPLPLLKLIKTHSRLYNINSNEGVPIAFEKNASVNAITIIVGDDILEFDELGDGEICGITIPHSAFEKIGKYNIKIFPFSFDDYDKINNTQQPTISSKPIIVPKYDVVETIKPIVSNVLNITPYNPVTPTYNTIGSSFTQNTISVSGLSTGGGGLDSYDS